MAQGLRKHRHSYYEVESKYYYERHRSCMIRNTHYECIICGHEYHEVSELSQGPPKERNKISVIDMDFLKDVLGKELFSQVFEKINAYNGNEANKGRQIKVVNLANGEYVGKGKYMAFEDSLKAKDTELATVNDLIA